MNQTRLTVLIMLLCLVTTAWAETPYQLFPPASPPASTIYVGDFRNATPDERLTASTLQGLINSEPESSVWLLLTPTDEFWLNRLKEKAYIHNTQVQSPAEFFKAQAQKAERVYLYDPALPASINMATMLASLNKGFVAHPDLAEGIFKNISAENLSGRWQTAAEAYEWAFTELWPKMNHRMLACYHPDPMMTGLRDYLVLNRVFTFWITDAKKDPDAAAKERAVVEKMFGASPPNVPVLGFWYSSPDAGINEYDGVGLAGEYGKITVVSDWASNCSVLGGIRVDFAPVVKAYRERNTVLAPPFDPARVYIAFNVVESGDAQSYLETRQISIWDDPARGSVPINWGFGLGTAELMPPVAEYYLETATANDRLFAAISGAGYVHPFRNFMARVKDPEAGWREYFRITNTLMYRLGFTGLGLYTDAWRRYDRTKMDPIMTRFADGVQAATLLMPGMGRDDGMNPANGTYAIGQRNTMVAHILTRWPLNYASMTREERLDWLIKDIRDNTTPARPAFMQVMALSWAYTPSDIAEIAKRLGEQYVPVSLPQYEALWRAAQKSQGD